MNNEICEHCSGKTLLIFKCKCGGKYCANHRLSIKHKCSYDFKKDRVEMPKIVAEKIIKI